MARLQASISYRYFAKSRPDLVAMPFHSHAYYEFYYFHHGKGNYLIGDKIFILHRGESVLNDLTFSMSPIPDLLMGVGVNLYWR